MGKHIAEQTILVNSALWTGRRPDVTYHFGFKSKTQLPLFMVYKLWGNPKDPDYGAVVFTTMDWTPSRIAYRWLPRLATWMSMRKWDRYPNWIFYPFADLAIWFDSWRKKD